MTRTTISLHESVLKQAKKIAHEQHRSLGETITELLNIGLEQKSSRSRRRQKALSLPSFNMGEPLVSLDDKEAVMALMEKKPL